MLMVENCPDGGAHATDTWVVTIASPTTMRLEAMVDEDRLDLLAEGPPDWILAQIDTLNQRAATRAASRAASRAARSMPILARP